MQRKQHLGRTLAWRRCVASRTVDLKIGLFGFRDVLLVVASTLLVPGYVIPAEVGRIEIVVAVGNQASLQVARKAGAVEEGTLRNRIAGRDRVHDAVMFSLIPEDFSRNEPLQILKS